MKNHTDVLVLWRILHMGFEKVIFVSEDDTYTAPVARAIFESKMKNSGEHHIEAESRGMVVLFPEPVNQKAVAIAKSRGIDMKEYRASQVDGDMFGSDTLVLVMADRIKASLYEKYKNAMNVYTIREFCGISGDVETPYGKGTKEYGESYTQMEELVKQVIAKLEVQSNP